MGGVQHIHRSTTDFISIPNDILKCIIEHIPESREVLQLYSQLRKALPIQNFQAVENCMEDGMIRFRDMRVPIRALKDFIPGFIFPIQNEEALILRLSHIIRIIPSFIGFDSSKEENIQYISQVNFLNFFKDWLKNYSLPAGEYVIRNQEE